VLSVSLDDLRLFLHVLAATVWVGGQITLAGLVPALRKAGADVPKAAANAFNRVAWPAFGVLIITGIWNIQADHGDIKHSADYRNTLIAKLVIVALSGLSAYLHAKADTKKGNAIWGALTGIFALLALFYGIILGTNS
jgi:putative copper export protein